MNIDAQFPVSVPTPATTRPSRAPADQASARPVDKPPVDEAADNRNHRDSSNSQAPAQQAPVPDEQRARRRASEDAGEPRADADDRAAAGPARNLDPIDSPAPAPGELLDVTA